MVICISPDIGHANIVQKCEKKEVRLHEWLPKPKKVLILFFRKFRHLQTLFRFAERDAAIKSTSSQDMKKTIVVMVLSLFAVTLTAQQKDAQYRFVEASDLTMVGKLMTDTPNPYHRVDTVRFKGFTKNENAQVRMSAGLAVAFRTDSRTITVKTKYNDRGFHNSTTGLATRGYDLYIKKDGKWLWAASGMAYDHEPEKNAWLIGHMDGSMHECLMYLPILSEEKSIQIGVDSGSVIEPIENPFRHRIGIFGSSFTHGISLSRAGMSYPDQLSRMTGLQFLSLGCSGNCKLQSYFADVLCAAQVDALVFDTFSNPSPEQIEERLFPFIEKVQATHPGIPMIFQRTIYRENRNFDTESDSYEARRTEVADSLMKIAVKKYQDVYYLTVPCATAADHETSVDGIHPSDYGYTLWAESVRKPIVKILRKYGIR
jgi:hypothetical protein